MAVMTLMSLNAIICNNKVQYPQRFEVETVHSANKVV